MFVTIRAKLIGLSFLSLLFIALVGGFGYYSNVELADALVDTHGKQEAINYLYAGEHGSGRGACRRAATPACVQERRIRWPSKKHPMI